MKSKIKTWDDLLIYEDDDFFIINKPPFISSLDDRVDALTIVGLARTRDPGAQLCHRLDKETSGVLVIARTPEAYRHMSMQLEKRKVDKIYHAVVDGLHDFKDQRIDIPLSVAASGTVRIDRRYGKRSRTIVNSVKAYRKHTLVSCQLMTGRMHQIRVHLSAMQAPVTGDETYGGKPFYLSSVKRNYHSGRFKEERPLIQRVALHAKAIEFRLMNHQVSNFEAPYPKDFNALINQLEKNS